MRTMEEAQSAGTNQKAFSDQDAPSIKQYPPSGRQSKHVPMHTGRPCIARLISKVPEVSLRCLVAGAT